MDISKFIYHKENVFSDEFCDKLVSLFQEKEKEDEVAIGSMAGGLDLNVKNTTEINLYDFPELVSHENFFSVINKHLSDHFLNNLQISTLNRLLNSASSCSQSYCQQ